MISYLCASIIASTIGITYYSGLYQRINQQIRKVKIMLSLVNKLKTQDQSNQQFTVDCSDTIVTIVYDILGQKYTIKVPYNRSFVASMIDFKAELIRNSDGAKVDITQQPGIPYLVSPTDLDGDVIIVTNTSTGAKYNYTVPPLYAQEVMEKE